ncbi:hypothetical protein KY329_04700 [Candidatus Woesearchaeota archaeon]|nr:hypothetical protein [Candidatus Woesearchaeota archaeon]
MNERALIAKVESALVRGADDYFRKEGFVRIPTIPHVVGITGACENIDTLFRVDFFGRKGFLTQTGQLALELQIPALRKVCCELRSFRAETDADNRHLTEFPLLEFEFAYTGDGFSQLLDHVEKTVKKMFRSALDENEVLAKLNVDRARLIRMAYEPFARIEYSEAVNLLNKNGFDVKFGDDLKHNHEQKIIEIVGKPTFIMRYPEKIKFFNMRRDRQNPELAQSADLILPFSGEAVGSAVREENPNLLIEKLKNSTMFDLHLQRGGKFSDFEWYLNAVKENPVPHAGCGIGLNRVTQCVLGRNDIRKCTAYAVNCESDLNKM